MSRQFTIALVGNPNSGKSSLFNALTGLNQKVGNFPGVTVDKKTGVSKITDDLSANIIDLPGTYSLYPKSADEQVTYEVLLNQSNAERPDLIVVIADASNLKRNLLFCSQIMDLKIPVIIALTMLDIAKNKGVTIDVVGLQNLMGVPVVGINPRKSRGIAQLKKIIASQKASVSNILPDFIDLTPLAGGNYLEEIRQLCALGSTYAALHIACNFSGLRHINAAQRIRISALLGEGSFQQSKIQAGEILERYRKIDGILSQCTTQEHPSAKIIASDKIDKVLLHPVWGNVLLLTVLFLLFQSIFWLAKYPMDWIQQLFTLLGDQVGHLMAEGMWKDLVVNGILAGASGILVFVPQIMILFGFITILEDSGYMARISFLTDRIMRSAGLNGRSVMPLISGMACAVPAIMAARTIQNKKERLITILVTPLMSCSARLPVYTMLIALVIPDKQVGIFNVQGLVLMGLYLSGFFMALLVSKVLGWFMKAKERSFFLMELPVYRPPRWKNVGITMFEKGKIFIRDVGKVILVLSLVLWTLAYFGPPKEMKAINTRYDGLLAKYPEMKDSISRDASTARLEHSFAGLMGKAIEPAIRPLGYDWKIGIALITSFAAREVFVGTMATLYSVGETDADGRTLREKMKAAKKSDGTPVYTLATGLSLLIFYAFAMQCMSTLAIVKRETRSWKIPAFQFAYMLALAWISAYCIYQIFK